MLQKPLEESKGVKNVVVVHSRNSQKGTCKKKKQETPTRGQVNSGKWETESLPSKTIHLAKGERGQGSVKRSELRLGNESKKKTPKKMLKGRKKIMKRSV